MRQRDKRLVFSPITKRWEIAHQEVNLCNGRKQWAREDMSTICYVGDELGVETLPAPITTRRKQAA
jgi:hypothetical protein